MSKPCSRVRSGPFNCHLRVARLSSGETRPHQEVCVGSGTPRRDGGEPVEARPLSPQINAALQRALARLDQAVPAFKSVRDEERDSQLSKMWSRKCKEIDDLLRVISNTLLESHQVALDQGSEGGGRSQRPWLEETSHSIERLYFQLNGNEVVATMGSTELLRGPASRVATSGLKKPWSTGCSLPWSRRRGGSR